MSSAGRLTEDLSATHREQATPERCRTDYIVGAPERAAFNARHTTTPCTTCKGSGGRAETTTGRNGSKITTWRPCVDCRGTGHR